LTSRITPVASVDSIFGNDPDFEPLPRVSDAVVCESLSDWRLDVLISKADYAIAEALAALGDDSDLEPLPHGSVAWEGLTDGQRALNTPFSKAEYTIANTSPTAALDSVDFDPLPHGSLAWEGLTDEQRKLQTPPSKAKYTNPALSSVGSIFGDHPGLESLPPISDSVCLSGPTDEEWRLYTLISKAEYTIADEQWKLSSLVSTADYAIGEAEMGILETLDKSFLRENFEHVDDLLETDKDFDAVTAVRDEIIKGEQTIMSRHVLGIIDQRSKLASLNVARKGMVDTEEIEDYAEDFNLDDGDAIPSFFAIFHKSFGNYDLLYSAIVPISSLHFRSHRPLPTTCPDERLDIAEVLVVATARGSGGGHVILHGSLWVIPIIYERLQYESQRIREERPEAMEDNTCGIDRAIPEMRSLVVEVEFPEILR
jgi:hypothetical protein